ncbi:MAG TPA: hypothetical protein VK158_00325 [Acidobacteriota bacterium]|nr:hypothetical protein [Acidobacteriota bacterium]
MNTRKAQSALEFLTTYGWAFLVILIMIGALSYFGVLDPARFLPDKCVATTGFACLEVRVSASAASPNSIIMARVVNGGGKTITLANISDNYIVVSGSGTCTNESTAWVGNIAWEGTTGNSVTWNSGQEKLFAWNCTGAAPSANERIQLQVIGTYSEAGSTLGAKPFELMLNARVQS